MVSGQSPRVWAWAVAYSERRPCLWHRGGINAEIYIYLFYWIMQFLRECASEYHSFLLISIISSCFCFCCGIPRLCQICRLHLICCWVCVSFCFKWSSIFLASSHKVLLPSPTLPVFVHIIFSGNMLVLLISMLNLFCSQFWLKWS